MSDAEPCPKCGLRSCQVASLAEQHDKLPEKIKPLTAQDFAQERTRLNLERQMTIAQDNCDAFTKARKKPS